MTRDWVDLRIAATASLSGSAVRATMATSAPEAANRAATAKPIPLLPPVTIAARRERLISIASSQTRVSAVPHSNSERTGIFWSQPAGTSPRCTANAVLGERCSNQLAPWSVRMSITDSPSVPFGLLTMYVEDMYSTALGSLNPPADPRIAAAGWSVVGYLTAQDVLIPVKS